MNNNSSYILLVQTEEIFNQRASLDLKDLGYSPVMVSDTKQALIEAEKLQPILIIIDHTKNPEESLIFCRQLREKEKEIRILIVVCSDNLDARITCLDAGADDYLTKPYRSETLIKLIELYLQPSGKIVEQMKFGELILDLSTRCLLFKDQSISLTTKEFELLKYLMSNSSQVLSREKILENVWGYDFQGASNVIEVYIRYLRIKIEKEDKKRYIHTVRGKGYILKEPNQHSN